MRTTPGEAASQHNGLPAKMLFVVLGAFLTLLWSIFTPPERTFATRMVLLQPLWAVRIYVKDATWSQDLLLFLSLHALYGYLTGAWSLFAPNDFRRLDLDNGVLTLYIEIFALLGMCGGLAGGIVHRGHQLKDVDRAAEGRGQSIDEQLLPPLLITSRTTHSRVFPKKHSFSYSYLLVGVPVGIRGRISDALSVDSERRSWFDVNAADYLARGTSDLGLAGKLKRYLHAQGITDRDYAFAYLITAPRFLNYSFNPVSFWYIYDSETVLKYMILEVNNTFDERRVYLLRSDGSRHDSSIDLLVGAEDGDKVTARMHTFSETWDKDFHVSPFNSRKGSYSLRATDPLTAFQEPGRVTVDNTIVLRSSTMSPKIVARIQSEGPATDAAHISRFELIKFISAWWWVGFATFPRIIWEAQKLFFRRKLDVWYRPEVTETSIGRAYTGDEDHLETFFRVWLENVIGHCNKPFRLIYRQAHAPVDDVVMYSSGFTYEEDHQRTLILKVLSPAFYSRFVHYAHTKEAFDRECLAADEKNRTLVIENASLLPLLLDAVKQSQWSIHRKPSLLEQVRWSWLRRLRCPPPEVSYLDGKASTSDHSVTDIRSFADSELDSFVKRCCPDRETYRKIVTKLFLARRCTFGVPSLVSLLDGLLRILLLMGAIAYISYFKAFDIFRPEIFELKDTVLALVLANAVHIWSLTKG